MKQWPLPLWLELSLAVLAALLVSNGVTFIVAEHRRSDSIRIERLGVIEDRLSALCTLLNQLPEENWQRLLAVASVRHERVSIGDRPRVAQDADRDERAESRLRATPGLAGLRDIRVAKRGSPQLNLLGERKRGGYERFNVAIGISQQKWINAEFRWPDDDALLPGLLFSAVTSGTILILLVAWIAMRLSGPLQELALASQHMTSGRPVGPLSATGPSVVRRAVSSFNDMVQRIVPLVDNQRVVLASVGHDLRTPITSLRLKSEFIDDEELRNQFVCSIDELQSLTEAALAASRDRTSSEECRVVDVGHLVESACLEMANQGCDVRCASSAGVTARCRAGELKRAVRNLIENGVKYGGSVSVHVAKRDGRIVIAIEDNGPGIGEEDISRAFEPFVRLPQAGGAPKPGHGLGLMIARAIARGHRGDVVLRNRTPHGRRAELSIADG